MSARDPPTTNLAHTPSGIYVARVSMITYPHVLDAIRNLTKAGIRTVVRLLGLEIRMVHPSLWRF